MNIKLLADRILIEASAPESKTASGIIIPDSSQKRSQKGTIVAVGQGTKLSPMTLKVGDKVLYGVFTGFEIHIDGKEYVMMKESDVYATI